MASPPRNTEFAKQVGKRLALLIEESGVTQTETSFDLRVQTPVLSRWCAGVNLPSTESIVRIAEHFGVSADWILGLSTERTRAVVRSRTAFEIVEMTDELAANPPRPRERSNRRRS